MKYAHTTPESVCSKYADCGDTKEFIKTVLEYYPNVRLGKADLWTLDWTRNGYARNEYIILKDVSDDDLHIMRTTINPDLLPFEVLFRDEGSVKGYVDKSDGEIWIIGEERVLGTIFHKHHFEYDVDANHFINRTLLKYRSNLKEYVLKGNRRFKINELFHWGTIDPLIDVRRKLDESNFPMEFVEHDNGWSCFFKETRDIEINFVKMQTGAIVKLNGCIYIENNMIDEHMISRVVL